MTSVVRNNASLLLHMALENLGIKQNIRIDEVVSSSSPAAIMEFGELLKLVKGSH